MEQIEQPQPLLIEMRNEITLGDVKFFSNCLTFEQLVSYAKGVLEDDVFKAYLGFYKLKKQGLSYAG